MTMPLFSAPDEQWHMVNAQGYAHGDVTNPFVTDGIPVDAGKCYQFLPSVSADCMDLTWGLPGTEIVSRATDYPPASHLVAALPALFVDGLAGAYVMRVWMALVTAGLFAWAGAVLLRVAPSRRLALTGLLLSATPMVAFMSGAVSPSGITAASACLFSAGAVYVNRAGACRSGVAATAIGLALLVASRRDGLLWAAVLGVAFAPMTWRPFTDGWRRLTRKARAYTIAGTLITTVLAGPRLVEYGVNFVRRHDINWSHARLEARGALMDMNYIKDLIGRFGWLDTRLHQSHYLAAMLIVLLFVIAAWIGARGDQRWAIGVATTAVLVAPIAVGLFRSPYMQGRYLFPVWCGAMVASSAVALPNRLSVHVRRGAPLMWGAWCVVHVVAWYVTLRRHTVGSEGPIAVWDWHRWEPEILGLTGSLFAATCAVAVAGASVARLASTADREHETATSILS
jgi:hypothetical protein